LANYLSFYTINRKAAELSQINHVTLHSNILDMDGLNMDLILLPTKAKQTSGYNIQLLSYHRRK